MAFNFPNAPSLGQLFTPVGGVNYVWDGTAWRGQVDPTALVPGPPGPPGPAGPAGPPASLFVYPVGPTPPASPSVGQTWFHRGTGVGDLGLLTWTGAAWQKADGEVLTEADVLLGDEPSGLAIGFRDGSALIRDPVGSTDYEGSVNGLLTYTAPSPKMVWDAAGLLVSGSTIRCDHDPLTHEPLGVLIEGQRTNLLMRSQEFNNVSVWSTSSTVVPPVVTPNTTTAPDGTMTADNFSMSALSGPGGYNVVAAQVPTITTGPHTWSIWLKGNVGGEKLWMCATPDGFTYIRTAITLTTNWVRYTLTGTMATGHYLQLGTDLRDLSQTPTPACSFKAWGAQLEAGAFRTSYIPTVAAQVTRAKDSISLLPAAFPYNTAASTMVVRGAIESTSGSRWFELLKDGLNMITILQQSGTTVYAPYITAISGAVVSGLTYTLPANTEATIAVAAAANDFGSSMNGSVAITDMAGAMPLAATTMFIGNSQGSLQIDGHLRYVKYLPRRATNAQLQAMTS